MNAHSLAGLQHCSCHLLERSTGWAEPRTRALHQRRRHASGQCRAAKQQQSAPTSDKPDPGEALYGSKAPRIWSSSAAGHYASALLSSGAAGLGLKAVWYGAEQFGNVLGLTKRRQASKSEAAAPPKARCGRPLLPLTSAAARNRRRSHTQCAHGADYARHGPGRNQAGLRQQLLCERRW